MADPSVYLGKDAMTPATEAEKLTSYGNNPRAPHEAELDHAKPLAMNEFLKHGVPANSLRV
jgi:hypothetical protein